MFKVNNRNTGTRFEICSSKIPAGKLMKRMKNRQFEESS